MKSFIHSIRVLKYKLFGGSIDEYYDLFIKDGPVGCLLCGHLITGDRCECLK